MVQELKQVLNQSHIRSFPCIEAIRRSYSFILWPDIIMLFRLFVLHANVWCALPGDSWESPKVHLNQLQSSSVQSIAGPFQ